MKNIKFLGVVSAVLVGLALPASAGPRGGGVGFGGGGHFGDGGRVGGFVGGGSRDAPGLYGGGFRAAPAFSGAYFTGRSVGRPITAPRFYYGTTRMAAVQPRGFARSVGRSTSPYVGRFAAANPQPNPVTSMAARNRAPDPRISNPANRQPNRQGSVATRNRVSAWRTSTAPNRQATASRQAFLKDHASERHDANNWHRDWDKHHSHFHNGRVFVFLGGFWWGLDPGYYPWDYGNYGYDSPYDYSYGNPYDYYNYYPYNNDDQPAYAQSDQSAAIATVSAVQSELANLGYYNGAIDGTPGDQTEAAIAHYQEDNNLSVTGSVDAATLQSLGVR